MKRVFPSPPKVGTRRARRPTRSADFELTAEAIPHIVWMASPDGRFDYVNRRGLDDTGPPPDDEAWSWLSFVHPDDLPAATRAWRQALETETSCEIEFRLRRVDGAFRQHELRAEPLRASSGTILKWIGTCTDIENRRRLEDDLIVAHRETAEMVTLLDTLLTTAPIGFGFVDREFRYQRVNQVLASMNGPSVEEHLGRTVADVVPELWPAIEPRYQQMLETGQPVIDLEMTDEATVDSSHARHWLVSMYPVRGKTETEVVGIGLVVLDISERKRAEEAHANLTRAAVEAVAATAEARDPYTAGHQRRVADISAAIGTELGLESETVRGIWLGASIHDVGKIAVPADILTKPIELHPAEWELIKTHAQAGHDIVAEIAFPWPIAEMILQHHERLDGSGYPNGRRGDEIGIGARIIAVADTLDAMAKHRPYRPARGMKAALDVVVNGRGTLYDAAAVDACLRSIRNGRLVLDGLEA